LSKCALITGGAGFLGSHVADHCLKQGQSVVVLDDLSGGFESNIPHGAQFVKGSVTDDALVRKIFDKYRFDYVYHLAAYAAEGLSHFIRRFNYTNNLLGTVTILNAAIRAGTIERFVFTSSIAVYGSAQVPMDEDVQPRPEDPYGISKYAAELDIECAHRLFGLAYTIFRPHNVYGERQNIGDRYRNVIGIFIKQLMNNEPMSVFGDGLQTRAFTHVDEVAPLIAQCVKVPASSNDVFNVGADTPHTVMEVACVVADAFGVKASIRHLPPRQEVVHAYSVHSKAAGVFGKPPAVSLPEGVRRMVAWAKVNGPITGQAFGDIEIREKLPATWAALSVPAEGEVSA
jgi:UDP-glucose 4-epimerase